MKKLLFLCSLIFTVVFGLTFYTPVYAEEMLTVAGGEEEPSQLQVEPVEVGEPVVDQKTEYTLPFPGILPDHPLYFLKRMRDAILERLISDPLRKAEFYILQADKRLQMGAMLTEAGKGNMGETTISKAEKYMDQAITVIAQYKKGGSVIPPYIIERLENATAKHAEVITDLAAKAGEAEKAGLTGSLNFVSQLKEKLIPLQ